MPIRYFLSDAGLPGLTASDFQAAVGRAFATWHAVSTASVAYELAGFTAARPGDEDGQTTLGFEPRPDLDRVLAATSLLFDDATGEIVEADIVFNSAFRWSVAAGGEVGRFDVESIALHEIGHLSGLGHSALGETELQPDGRRRLIAAGAVMFPIAFPAGSTSGRMLRADDVAAISTLYPASQFTDLGSLSGRVTKAGRGLFGAHIVAFDPQTGAMVAGFSLDPEGRFVIGGLSPGPRLVRVEPLDDADIESFFSPELPVDVDYRASFLNRLVVVPRGGGGSAPVAVEVTGK